MPESSPGCSDLTSCQLACSIFLQHKCVISFHWLMPELTQAPARSHEKSARRMGWCNDAKAPSFKHHPVPH